MVTLSAFLATLTTIIGSVVAAVAALWASYQVIIKGGWFVAKLVYRITKRRRDRQ